jgi:short-chain fatty acids transporter
MELGQPFSSKATLDSYPFIAYITRGFVNFAIPFAEGEFAVVGPRIINAVKEIGAGLPASEMTTLISKASLSIAQGESFSNTLQPFHLLIIMPAMGT